MLYIFDNFFKRLFRPTQNQLHSLFPSLEVYSQFKDTSDLISLPRVAIVILKESRRISKENILLLTLNEDCENRGNYDKVIGVCLC